MTPIGEQTAFIEQDSGKILLPDEPVYMLFSGGKDSFASASILHDAGLLKGCVIIDTGISADTWLEDVTNLCLHAGWNYETVPTTTRYEWFVWKYGFPGPGMHYAVMNYLKGRAVRQWKQRYPAQKLASGVRLDESTRRTFNAKWESRFEGVTVYAPLLHWTTAQVWAYLRTKEYQKPRTYVTLGVSGDCLCGAYAEPHERDAIFTYYPLAAKHIRRCEKISGQRWGAGSADKTWKVNNDAQALLCFDCKRTEHPGVSGTLEEV